MSLTMFRRGMMFCLALLGTAGVANAQAFDGYHGPGFPWFGYGNNGPAAYALGNIPAPPYFALHPPVYYSHPTPRTYGQSPFAHPGHAYQADRPQPPRPMMNPFIPVKPSEPSKEQEKPVKVTVIPLRIPNPYYSAPNPTVLGD